MTPQIARRRRSREGWQSAMSGVLAAVTAGEAAATTITSLALDRLIAETPGGGGFGPVAERGEVSVASSRPNDAVSTKPRDN